MDGRDIQIKSEMLALAGAARFDRAAHLREDQTKLDKMRHAAGTTVVLLWQGKPLVHLDEQPRLARVHPSILDEEQHQSLVFLGLAPDPVFAADLTGFQPDLADSAAVGGLFDQSVQPFPAVPGTGFQDLRQILTALPPLDTQLAGTACGLIAWHRTHGFCATCGTASTLTQGGWQRQCPSCHRSHFPRTDPVVIMLIHNGDDVLLARSLGWPEKLWSLPAGFVEPGETIEAAVRREIFEETGISSGRVTPLLSQSWPFPASLMIGCMAPAESVDISIDCSEIDAAEWVSRSEMRRVLDGHTLERVPPRNGAIARHILEYWVEGRLTPFL